MFANARNTARQGFAASWHTHCDSSATADSLLSGNTGRSKEQGVGQQLEDFAFRGRRLPRRVEAAGPMGRDVGRRVERMVHTSYEPFATTSTKQPGGDADFAGPRWAGSLPMRIQAQRLFKVVLLHSTGVSMKNAIQQ